MADISHQEAVELRGKCPRWVVDVLDAVAMARKEDRTEVVNRVLEKWAQGKIHESMLIQRVTRSNGSVADCCGGKVE